MSPNHGSRSQCALDFLRTCRFLDSCELINQPDGCSICLFARGPPRIRRPASAGSNGQI